MISLRELRAKKSAKTLLVVAAMANAFRGVSADRDARFGDKMKKLLRTTPFPAHFNEKVDMKKVQLDAMLPWISQEVSKYLGFEDDVVVGYVETQLRAEKVDPKEMQLHLTGFLEKNTSSFMGELWTLLLSAQSSAMGIPQQFLDKKKEEIREKRAEQERMAELLRAKKADLERRMAEEAARRGGGGDGGGGGGLLQLLRVLPLALVLALRRIHQPALEHLPALLSEGPLVREPLLLAL